MEIYKKILELLKVAERFWEDNDMSDYEGYRENLKFFLTHHTTQEDYLFKIELRFWRDGIAIEIKEEDESSNFTDRHLVTYSHFFKGEINYEPADKYYWAKEICSKMKELEKKRMSKK